MDLSLDLDDVDLQRLDSFIDAAYKSQAAPVAGPSNVSRPLSKGSFQTTLFGDVLPRNEPSPASRGPMQRSKSDRRNPFGQQAPKTKQWDHTAFAKSGWRKPKGKAVDEDEQEEEKAVEFEQFPAPFVSGAYKCHSLSRPD